MLEQPAEQPEEWVSAANAVALLGMAHFLGTRTICKRAHAGLIKARAERFISNGQSQDNVDIPTEFWWAQGGAALHQNWTTGDFDTWIDHRIHLQAFGVTFRRSDIEGARPTTVVEQIASIPSQTEPPKFSDVVTLKPTLWGMSIDLLKVWNWLQFQFPKMASILNRLWRDPVLSIVIATGITAGIGALAAWYFHSQTPPPATTPAPAIPAAPLAVTQQPPQSPSAPKLPNPSQTPVVWDRGSQFLIVTGGGPNAQINSVLLQGKSTRSVSIKEAYAVSGLTGHKQELMANVQYKGYYPVDQVDIPPQAPVWLELLFKPPLSVGEFLAQWGQLRVTIIYSDGTTADLNFDENYVRQKLQQMSPDAFGPHVTPRAN